MTFFYGQSQLKTAEDEFTRCWMARDPKSPETVKLAYHALIMLSTGIKEALEDFAERLPPAKK
ncbi:MAG: hypothetical protein AB7S71_01620 [Dongiaceae bacterium]